LSAPVSLSRPEIAHPVQVVGENLAVAIGQPIVVHNFLEPSNRFVEFVFVPLALEIAQLLANLVEPPPVAAVGIGAGLGAVEIGWNQRDS